MRVQPSNCKISYFVNKFVYIGISISLSLLIDLTPLISICSLTCITSSAQHRYCTIYSIWLEIYTWILATWVFTPFHYAFINSCKYLFMKTLISGTKMIRDKVKSCPIWPSSLTSISHEPKKVLTHNSELNEFLGIHDEHIKVQWGRTGLTIIYKKWGIFRSFFLGNLKTV